MRHIPHVYVPRPWDTGILRLSDVAKHHLRRVLRRADGSPLTYTDGVGTIGEGRLGDGVVVRGDEAVAVPPPELSMAVAPSGGADRMRFVVEKLAELGVTRLVWLATAHGRTRPPRADRCRSWVVAALQQSRGAHLMEVEGPVTWADLDAGGLIVVDPGGEPAWGDLDPGTIMAVGPEGGFDPDELPPRVRKVGLGPTVLRTETAAIVAAARALEVFRTRS